ncbi:NADH:flavin oxidoreductase/NADH oxidase [Auriscalpium vulgare]|uniref:NADH:flavin oxidoreductase/NADH oxidase n=1 Tax=Auriscalpium vulgare TaxID=40419 RepID=A0ACB8RD61_9AGAM|nr:NADH:flavin oxidoreductase/NADH oxidase [Auriscalpium vulgare]
MSASTPALFQPVALGDITLHHRIVMAPLTRFRADNKHAVGPMNLEYYAQRAAAPGTLIITEGTFIAPQAGGTNNIPGIWSDDQIAGWKTIVDAVHAKGSYIYMQLWTVGAGADPSVLQAEGYPYVAAGSVPFDGHGPTPPRPMSIEEMRELVELYATAARNAVHQAGFDGVEVHAANGYLLDQFLHTTTNDRTDAYGGSVDNRVRFPLEVLAAVVAAVGAKKTAIRVSPWSNFQRTPFLQLYDISPHSSCVRCTGERMNDPIPTYAQLFTGIRTAHPDLSYVHIVEPRVDGPVPREGGPVAGESNDFIRAIWGDRRIITTGRYTRESGIAAAERTGCLVGYGRAFLANPDLVRRLQEDLPLNEGDESTFYSPGPAGYIDYPFAPVKTHLA